MKAYEMKMLFNASLGLKTINGFLEQLGDSGKYQIKDAIQIGLTQVLPCVPDDEYIRKVEQCLLDNYETKEFNLTSCKFVGYEYLREIETDKIRLKEPGGDES